MCLNQYNWHVMVTYVIKFAFDDNYWLCKFLKYELLCDKRSSLTATLSENANY